MAKKTFDLPEGFTLEPEQAPVITPDEPVATEGKTFDLPEGFSTIPPAVELEDKPSTSVLGDADPQPDFSGVDFENIPTEAEYDYAGHLEGLKVVPASELNPEDIVKRYENIHSKYSTDLKQIKGIFNAQQRAEARQEVLQLKQGVLAELQNQGFNNPRYVEDTLYIDIDGQPQEVSVDLLDSLSASAFELGGAIAGAGAGGRAGASAPVPPLLRPATTLAGALGGGAVGAFTGRGADILRNQVGLMEEIDNKLILDQMTEAGLTEIVAGGLGVAVAKPLVGTSKVLLKGAKTIKQSFKNILLGNTEGASDALYKQFNITKSEADAIVKDFEKVAGTVEGTDLEKAIKVLATTRPRGEALIAGTEGINPNIVIEAVNSIFDRHKELATRVNKLTKVKNPDDSIYKVVTEDLQAYQNEVSKFYNALYESGGEFTQGYKFDYNKIGLDPLLETIGARIEDPRIKERFTNLLTKIGDITESRTFTDLIDLRKTVNNIKYNTTRLKFTDTQALNKAIRSIDTEIDRVADIYIPNSKVWKDNFDLANKEYSKMLALQDNVMYKALTRSKDSDAVIKLMSKYISAEDDTFYNVISKLPSDTHKRIEGEVLSTMVEKYSVGEIAGDRAINFPQLAREINKINWQTPEAKQLTKGISRMADIYKSDLSLAGVTKRIKLPQETTYLTYNPATRFKMDLLNKTAGYLRSVRGTPEGNQITLVKQTAKLLENPLNKTTLDDFLGAIPEDTRKIRDPLDFEPTLNELRNIYTHRKQLWEQTLGKEDIPPLLVWRNSMTTPTQELPSGQMLFATTRGTVAESPSKAIMNDNAKSLMSKFIWENTNTSSTDIVEKANKYLMDTKFKSIIQSVKRQMKNKDVDFNNRLINKQVTKEATKIIKNIEKDFGIKLPKEQADRIIKMKFMEVNNLDLK